MTKTSSTTPKTKPSRSEAEPLVPGARHAIAPRGIVATSWPRIKTTCRNIGWGFDPWQDAAGRLILAKGESGRWAADLSILSIPRQVGKSYLLGCIIFALCLLNPKLRVIWTSHHTATTEEMYEAMKELAAHKRVSPHVAKCVALQGSRWRITFRNGSRIDFGARSQGFGRGKARVGVLVLDEFQHINARALANLAPTTNTSDNPLILCAGTPPGPEVNGEAFRLRRKAALEGLSDDTLYIEFSADQGADPDDRKQWTKANPSFPKRTRERAFLLLRKILEPEDFMREALGVWDPEDAGTEVLPNWPNCKVDGLQPVASAIGVAVSFDRRFVSIGAAGMDGDHLLVGAVDHRPGMEWAIPELARMQQENGWPVVIDPGGPSAKLAERLVAAGVNIDEDFKTSTLGVACQGFHDHVESGTLSHPGHPELDAAVAVATRRDVGEGAAAWAWARRKSGGDISMLEAVTLAGWGAVNAATGPLIFT